MTNLLYYYPRFNFDYTRGSSATTGGSLTASIAGKDFKSENNLIRGVHQFYESESASTQFRFDFDLTGSNTLNPTKLILNGLFWSCSADSDDINVIFRGSNASNFSTGENESYTIALSDLVGHFQEIFIGEVSFSSAYRYYRVEFNFTESITLKLKKIYFTNPLDLGCDPLKPLIIRSAKKDFSFKNPYTFELKYKGLTNDQKQEIENKIFAMADSQGVFLHDTGDLLFQGREALFCLVRNWRLNRMMRDNWEVTLNLEAVI